MLKGGEEEKRMYSSYNGWPKQNDVLDIFFIFIFFLRRLKIWKPILFSLTLFVIICWAYIRLGLNGKQNTKDEKHLHVFKKKQKKEKKNVFLIWNDENERFWWPFIDDRIPFNIIQFMIMCKFAPLLNMIHTVGMFIHLSNAFTTFSQNHHSDHIFRLFRIVFVPRKKKNSFFPFVLFMCHTSERNMIKVTFSFTKKKVNEQWIFLLLCSSGESDSLFCCLN